MSGKQKAKRARDRRRQRARAERDAQGRVHLALHRDPATGSERVVLKSAIFQESWQNEIAAGGANTVRGYLGDEPSLERVLELARSVMAATSRLSDGLLARAPAGSVACKAGCDHCCYQSVGVTPPEALAIFDHLKRTRSPEELSRFVAYLGDRFEKTRGLSPSQRFSPDQPCVFLESGRCTVYEVRPLSCRGMNSLDAGECEKRLKDPVARAEFLASGAGSHSYMEPIRAFHAVSAGLQLGIAELYELDMRPLDLVAALQLLFTGPSSTAETWLEGQPAFEAARGGDSSDSLAVRQLSGRLTEPQSPPSREP
ncbi:MAG TPA: YkgJ family cysteine cluster protein [Polyangiaceae bacterium]